MVCVYVMYFFLVDCFMFVIVVVVDVCFQDMYHVSFKTSVSFKMSACE